jgi:hypothetical protein
VAAPSKSGIGLARLLLVLLAMTVVDDDGPVVSRLGLNVARARVEVADTMQKRSNQACAATLLAQGRRSERRHK